MDFTAALLVAIVSSQNCCWGPAIWVCFSGCLPSLTTGYFPSQTIQLLGNYFKLGYFKLSGKGYFKLSSY